MEKIGTILYIKLNVISYFGLYIFYNIFALKCIPDMVLDSEIFLYLSLINDICSSCPCVNRPLFTNPLADYSLSWSTWGLLCSVLFQYFWKLILYMYLCYHLEFEQQKCDVCECVRVSGALHDGYTVTVNYLWTQNPFSVRVCVCDLMLKHEQAQSPPLHTQQYTVCKYVCWSYNRVAGSSWYQNQFPCPVGHALLNDFWFIERVSTL